MLEQVRNISNPTVYSTMLVSIIDRFNQAVQLEKNERLLFAYLGLMICYYHLGETRALLATQEKVAEVKFHATFWEKHGGTIKQGGMFTLGAAMAVFGGGNSGIVAISGRTGEELKDEHKKELEYKERRFARLKNSIITLRFTAR